MKRSIANTYICIDAEGQAFPIIACEVISHLFDLMYDYEQEYAISNIGEEYSMSQVRDTSNLLAALIGSNKMQLENK